MTNNITVQETVERFIDLFDHELRLHPADPATDCFATEGRACLADIIRPAILAGQPIDMLLPGFPHKNPNRRKTLGVLPDLAEQHVLERLNAFCAKATDIYHPPGQLTGCRLTLFCDGRIWGDLLGVPLQTLTDYGKALRKMAPADSPHLCFSDLDEHCVAGEGEYVADVLEREWGAQTDLSTDDPTQLLARFARLTREDRQWQPEQDERHISAACNTAAHRMIRRLAALRQLLDTVYSDNVIRLSVHADTGAGPRFAVRLFPHAGVSELPYHCVMVLDAQNQSARPMHYEQAAALPGGVSIIHRDGQPWCLQRKNSSTANKSVPIT